MGGPEAVGLHRLPLGAQQAGRLARVGRDHRRRRTLPEALRLLVEVPEAVGVQHERLVQPRQDGGDRLARAVGAPQPDPLAVMAQASEAPSDSDPRQPSAAAQ